MEKFSVDRCFFSRQKINIIKTTGIAEELASFIDPCLCWEDIKMITTWTKLPIVIKGFFFFFAFFFFETNENKNKKNGLVFFFFR